MDNYLTAQRRSERAEKRGGGRAALSLDFATGERRYCVEPADIVTPERLFERRWAMTLLENALEIVRADYASKDQEELYLALQPHLHGEQERLPYAELADHLGMSEVAIKTAAYRLRVSFREALRRQIADIVANPEEVDDELKSLWAALSS